MHGFLSFPVDNLRASSFLLQYIQEEIPNYRNAVIAAKSPEAAKRAESCAGRRRLGLAVIHGEAQCRSWTWTMVAATPHPPSTVKNAVHPGLGLPLMTAKVKPLMIVVGAVGGRIAIIVDDIDNVESSVAATEILTERFRQDLCHGPPRHPFCRGPRLIEESSEDEVLVTNPIPHEVQKLQCPKIKTVDISLILSEATWRIHNRQSMAYLFRDITVMTSFHEGLDPGTPEEDMQKAVP
ncbi:Phosphoribosyl pyrophosphate synthase-associated protein 1 [Saguinus oedipus]|uniref:Phosphoribosyl pyrophosphate synthase-associated protein 1 n=1 Tax=Saguinus oedipus TaxID=9490 RepID=A0ABQ9U1X1_SAGOE|nr:Phosphoribosyl pyrophosphate synthase-associated protein 1 [Saguinus oedipus]